jgi:hypothetical protein
MRRCLNGENLGVGPPTAHVTNHRGNRTRDATFTTIEGRYGVQKHDLIWHREAPTHGTRLFRDFLSDSRSCL